MKIMKRFSASRSKANHRQPGALMLLCLGMLAATGANGQNSATNQPPNEELYAAAVDAIGGVVDTSAMSVNTGASKWFGIALAENTGKLYSAPRFHPAVLITDPVNNATDFTTLTFSPAASGNDYFSIAYAPNTGKLYCPPHAAALNRVLIISPLENTTDTTAITGFSTESGRQWEAIAYADITGKLYCPPADVTTVLIINPLTNESDATTISGLTTNERKYTSIAYCPTTLKLYSPPSNTQDAVLIIDPVTNSTDTTAMVGLRVPGIGSPWSGIVFAPITGKLYSAPHDGDTVLIINPSTNQTDTTSMSGFGTGNAKWYSIAYIPTTGQLCAAPFFGATAALMIDPVANWTTTIPVPNTSPNGGKWTGTAFAPSTGKLYTSPASVDEVLIVNPVVNEASLLTFRLIATQSAKQSITEAALESALATLAAVQANYTALESTVASLSASQASVCSRPVCGNGTTPVNGECIPDCPVLRRRDVSCEPFCDALAEVSPSGGSSGLTLYVSVAVVAFVTVGVAIAAFVYKQRSNRNPEAGAQPPAVQPGLAVGQPIDHVQFGNPVFGIRPHNPAARGLDQENYVEPNALPPQANGQVQEDYEEVQDGKQNGGQNRASVDEDGYMSVANGDPFYESLPQDYQ